MNIHSIRWRLPLSYAAIALLAAVALGSVMLLVLNDYYTRQERRYLMDNALALQPVVERVLQNSLPDTVLQNQVQGLAFLSQTQIRVLDAAGRVHADSGVPDANQVLSVSNVPAGVMFSMPVNPPVGGPVVQFTRPVEAGATPQVLPFEAGVAAGGGDTDMVLAVSAAPYGYGFVAAAPLPGTDLRRSSQVVNVPLLMLASGSTPGTLEISHGPAYGADILYAVTLAWLIASVVAILLAGLAGWFTSRQVTRPVLALTEATRQMEQGDLSIRARLPDEEPAQEFQALADSFNNMAQRVEDTVSTLRAFVSDAAHELNTPLTALKTNLELAANERNASQKALFLARALEQNRRLELLTAGLLDLSRIEAGRPTLALEPLDLRRLAAESGERFASRAEQAGRAFSLELPEGGLILPGNALQLQRALDNLLENALKFTPAGGAITLRLAQEGARAVLTVRDNGIGILPEDLPQLFERFHRGRNSAEFPGNGLGLAIARAIVEAHGGRTGVESAGRGQGSTFSIMLPC